MEAQITAVHPEYVDTGVDEHGHVTKVRGRFHVELTLTKGDGLTFEQANDHVRDGTRFTLTPIEE